MGRQKMQRFGCAPTSCDVALPRTLATAGAVALALAARAPGLTFNTALCESPRPLSVQLVHATQFPAIPHLRHRRSLARHCKSQARASSSLDEAEAAFAINVRKIQKLQRKDWRVNDWWQRCCDDEGDAVRDPKRQSPEFVADFLERYDDGREFKNYPIVELIKEGCRKSNKFAEAWNKFCHVCADGRTDPACHDKRKIADFLDIAGRGVSQYLDPADHNKKEDLIQKVKAFQRLGKKEASMWNDYCAEHQNQIRDPRRQDLAALEKFLDEYAVSHQ